MTSYTLLYGDSCAWENCLYSLPPGGLLLKSPGTPMRCIGLLASPPNTAVKCSIVSPDMLPQLSLQWSTDSTTIFEEALWYPVPSADQVNDKMCN